MEPKLPTEPQDETPVSNSQDNKEVTTSGSFENDSIAPMDVEPSTPVVSEAPADPQPEVLATTPLATPLATPPVGPVKPKKKQFMVAAIVAAILVVLIGGGASAYFLWYQKPEKVVLDATLGLLSASHVQSKTVVTSDSELAPGTGTNIKLKKISFDTKATSSVNGEFDASLTVSLNGRDYTTGGKAMIIDNGDVYFQLNGIKELIQKFIADFSGSGTALSAQAQADLGKLQDKWVKVTKSDLGDAGKTYQCFVDTYKKYENDKKVEQEMLDAYKKNPFVSIKNSVASKDGNLGYNVTFDKDTARKFAKAVDDTTVGKELKKCDTSSSVSDAASSVDTPSSADGTTFTATVWVSQWTHTLKGIDYNLSTKSPTGGKDLTFSGHTDISYDKSVAVSAPSSSVSLTDWLKDAQSFSEELFGSSSSMMPESSSDTSLFDSSI